MDTLTTILKWTASGGGMIAATMVSLDLGRRVTGWGLVLFAASALCWIGGAMLTKDFALGTQNVVLLGIDLFGAYRYLIRKNRMAETLAWPVLLGLLGAVIGSFVATLVIRWPQGRSVLRGRSHCDGCDTVLGPTDLVPLLSAALARGRCHRCGVAIDPLHWRIEAIALAIGALAGVAVPGPIGVAGAVFGWLLLALAALDVTEFWLPDALTLTLALAGLATGAIGVDPALADRLIGGMAGFGALWLVAFGYRALRGRDGLGGGDPKLFGAIGLWLGWRMLPAVLFLAALTGLAIVLFGMLRGRAARLDDRAPFGALLAVAAYPAWLFLLGSAA